jgi:hypothetical protein
VQALDTSSQGGSGRSLLLCILRLCEAVYKIPLIENPSSVEVRAIIRFLNAEQESPTEIHKDLVEVHSENVISRKQASVWYNEFKEGRTSLLDEEHAGRPKTACNAVIEPRVEQVLLTDYTGLRRFCGNDNNR